MMPDSGVLRDEMSDSMEDRVARRLPATCLTIF